MALQLGDDGRSNGGGRRASGGGGPLLPPPPPEEGFRCPRCDSPNTKFCYYNNYSLTQPRHYCKACRRYWTRGGALRNVPVGGGCRKSKKSKSSTATASPPPPPPCYSYSAPSSRLLLPLDICKDPISSYCSVVDTAANPYKFFHGFSPDFMNLGAGTNGLAFNNTANPLPPPPPTPTSTPNSLMDVNYSESTMMISMEQDLQWKLQQQRLSMFYGGGSNINLSDLPTTSSLSLQNNTQRHQAQKHFNNMDESLQFQAGGTGSSSSRDWYQLQPTGAGSGRNTSGNCTDVIMNSSSSSSNNNNNITWNDHIHHHFSALQ